MLLNDREITAHDLLELSSPDRITSFFVNLGYATTASSELDMDALKHELHHSEELRQRIRTFKHIAMRGDETLSSFYVYLYVLHSVTNKVTQDIFRDLRKRQGDFLFIMTDESYRELNIVYLDRFTGVEYLTQPVQSTLPGLFQDALPVKVGTARPRVLSFSRHNPGKVALRVLNRFRWVQGRSVAVQCDTLRSAYDIAEWSEENFNNRALFSDYYLKELLLGGDEWLATTRMGHEATRMMNAYRELRKLYDDARDEFSGKPAEVHRKLLLQPVLELLDFVPRPRDTQRQGGKRLPDYDLFAKDLAGMPVTKVGLCLAYAWGRNLDGYEDIEDALHDSTASENPGAVVVSLLDQEQVDWAILTNGKIWRLYSAKTHSRATNYYEIDLEETLAIPKEHIEEAKKAFRYFWLLFRSDAFIPTRRQGYTESPALTFLDFLLRESEDYARKLGDSLKQRIFTDVFPQFAQGFVHAAQANGTLSRDLGKLTEEERAALLKPFFDGTLTFLYRLLFLLYAESRDLLPVREQHGYYLHSLTKLKSEIAKKAGTIEHEVVDNIKQHYTEGSFVLYDALQILFAAIDKGSEELNVPTYNGGLFLTGVKEGDLAETSEMTIAQFLASNKIPDRYLARGLDKLARGEDDKKHELVQIDYKSLGVRQLGSIYEGLLEFKLRVAIKPMAVVKGKKTEEVVPQDEALRTGRYKKGPDNSYEVNQAYIENDRRERKATGSYYTPDYIVQYIIEHTVGPILDEKEAQLRPKFRRFEQILLEKQRDNKNLKTMGREPKDLGPTYAAHHDLVDEFFDIKVLDPAMGSGHFLVEAVDYITRRMIKFLDDMPKNPVRYELKQIEKAIAEEMERQGVTIDRNKLTEINLLKRQVLKRCIYGVDINRMAVELAKVSVWLDSFTLGAPLSFLDHHLKWGNSLIGARIDEARTTVEEGQLSLFFGSNLWAGALLSTEGMIRVSRLSDVTPGQARESKEEYQRAEDAIAPYKHLLDVYLSRWFSNPVVQRKKDQAKVDKALDFLRSDEAQAWIKNADKTKFSEEQETVLSQAEHDYRTYRFFHWELEFPEVFIDLKHASLKTDPGFDAVVGNPPYDILAEKERNEDLLYINAYIRDQPMFVHAIGMKIDLFRLFIARGIELVRRKGYLSQIVPMSLLADQQTAALRKHLLTHHEVVAIEAFPQKDDSRRRIFPEAKLPTCIITVVNGPNEKNMFFVTTHPGKILEEISGRYAASPIDIEVFDRKSLVIPTAESSIEFHLAKRLSNDVLFVELSTLLQTFQGEINETTMAYLLSDEPDTGPRVLRGGNVQRYEFLEEAKQGSNKYLKQERYKKEIKGRRTSHSTQLRIGYQRNAALDNWRRLIFGPLPNPCHCFDSISYFLAEGTSTYFYLAVLNSSLQEWRFRLTSSNNHVSTDEIASLPIRRINFTTLPDQRASSLEQAKQLYQQSLSESKHDSILSFVNHHLSQEPEASDIVHDLLAYLAEEMLRLNKEKRAEQQNFLAWLVEALRIQPDKDGKTGIDALKGKSQLANYPGDYQKGEDALKFAEIRSILQENKKRLGVLLSEGLLAKIEQQYQQNLARVLPLKGQLARTDALIDQIVYKLYGLTQEEIDIVEGKGSV